MGLELAVITLISLISTILIVDTFQKPDNPFQNFQKKRFFNRVRSSFNSKINTWIVLIGPSNSGKSTLLQKYAWEKKDENQIQGTPYCIWQHPSQPIGVMEMSLNIQSDDIKSWSDALKGLNPQKKYVCIDPTKLSATSYHCNYLGDVEILLTHCEKIKGFSLFMKSLQDTPWRFKLPTKTAPMNLDSIQDSFDKVDAQLQGYTNHLLQDIDDREARRAINDFPQHFNQLKFHVAKIIKAFKVNNIYCTGLIWQSGQPNLIFSPKLEADLIIKEPHHPYLNAALFSGMIFFIALQLTWYQNRMNQLWENQPLYQLMDASTKLDKIKGQSIIVSELFNWFSPSIKLSLHQVDQIKTVSQEIKLELSKINPLIASLKLRHYKLLGIDKQIAPFVLKELKPTQTQFEEQWHKSTLQEQFIASLHYVHGQDTISNTLPKELKTQEACSLLENRLSIQECENLSKQWLSFPKKNLNSLSEVIQLIADSQFDVNTNDQLNNLKVWLEKINQSSNQDYLSFEFLLNHVKNPNVNHILNQLEKNKVSNDITDQIISSTWQLLMDNSARYINSVWVNTIYPYYENNLRQYPIDPNSLSDIELSKFLRFYSKKGLLELFYTHYILPFTTSDRLHTKPIYRQSKMPINETALNYLANSAPLQSLSCMADDCSIEFTLKPNYKNESWTLQSMNASYALSNETTLIWPQHFDKEGVTIKSGRKDYIYRGIWGFWRWLEKGQMNQNVISFENHAFTISSPNTSPIEFINSIRKTQIPSSLIEKKSS